MMNMMTVLAPGLRSTFQDAGRSGYAHLGVPRSGAADAEAFEVANRLAGNPVHSPAIETIGGGLRLRAEAACVVAVTGADVTVTVDEALVPEWHPLPLRAGQELALSAPRSGVYAYVAVAGGFSADRVLGSASSCSLSGLGPAPLAAGQQVAVEVSGVSPAWDVAVPVVRPTAPVVRVLRGPHEELFPAGAFERFLAGAWAVSSEVSRVGARLAGARVQSGQGSLPSLGMVRGAVQVPPGGEPIVLGPDHGATGGYPVLATVVAEDLGVMAQAGPGTRVRFVDAAGDAGARVAATRVFHIHAA